jgi:hypothetical protein
LGQAFCGKRTLPPHERLFVVHDFHRLIPHTLDQLVRHDPEEFSCCLVLAVVDVFWRNFVLWPNESVQPIRGYQGILRDT